jgi:DNA-binding SARP family transcriptional activator/tetratricopeptide (TPR) repeat protein/DNA-binding XRE family transcriptional regulator
MDRSNSGLAPQFGALLRARRRSAGLTQQELADLTGVGLAAIRDLEQGRRSRPRQGTVTRLAGVLGLEVSVAPVPGPALPPPGAVAGGAIKRAGRLAGPATGLRVQILGPLAAWRDGRQVGLGPPRQRAVLGQLALSPDCLVHRETLIDVLWGDDPPVTAVNLVQAYVSRLRRALDPRHCARDNAGVLVSSGAGYRLHVSAGQLDLLEFRRLCADARASRAAGDVAAACRLYEQALRLWDGAPLADLELLRGHPAVVGLGSQQAAAVTEYAEAAASAGWHDRVLTHVRALAGRDPLNEKAHAQLMIALAGGGHQAAALEVFEAIRRRLDDQLGIRPGPVLSRAHMRVLRQEIHIPDDCSSPAEGRVVPRQLPGAVRHFTGRAGELKALSGLLGETTQGNGMVLISAIGGTAGVGKTALAIYWAHQVAERFPDGQLYLNLRGFGPAGVPVSTAEAIRGFLDAFGVPAPQIPATLEAQVALYRSLATGRRMLVVLDNARDAEQVRPLLPGSPACLVVVTSRNQLVSLVAAEGACPLALDVLDEADARELLTRQLGVERMTAEPASASELIRQCARLPLALTVAAARAATQPHLSLARLADELRDATRLLDALDAGDRTTNIRAVFSWSYRYLSGTAARMFRLLGLHPGPDITAPAAASLAGIPVEQAPQVLAKLTAAHLLAEHVPGRFTFHDLLRVYAAEIASTAETDATHHAATQRMLDHYLHTAHAADRLLHAARTPLTLAAPEPGTAPEPLPDRSKAAAWLNAERKVLLAAIAQADRAGFDIHAWQLPSTLATFFKEQGHWQDWATTQHVALAAAQRLGTRHAQAETLRSLGDACAHLGSHQDAVAHLQNALDLYRRLGDRPGQARTHLGLARLFEQQGAYRADLGHCLQALGLYRAAGHQVGHARALNAVGWCHAHLADYKQALACCQEAIGLHRELGDRHGEAATWDSLGYIHHQLGQHPQAVACYQQAIDLVGELGDRYYHSVALTHLGDVHAAAGDPAAARNAWQQAVVILNEMNHPDIGQVRARLSEGRLRPARQGSDSSHRQCAAGSVARESRRQAAIARVENVPGHGIWPRASWGWEGSACRSC